MDQQHRQVILIAGEQLAALAALAVTQAGRAQVEAITLHSDGFGEPGCQGDSLLIALGNWNNISRWDREQQTSVDLDHAPSRAAALLEALGFEVEWSDQWVPCGVSGKLYARQPMHSGWRSSLWLDESDGQYVGIDAIRERDDLAEAMLESLSPYGHRHGEPPIVTMPLDFDRYGYVKVMHGLEHGLHGGQDADPNKIVASMDRLGVEKWFFYLDTPGQFDVTFSVWVHRDEVGKFDRSQVEIKADEDPAAVMERALRAVPIAAAEALKDQQPGDIVVVKVDGGRATARNVSPEEFSRGIE